jgi:hypothetical protein
MAVNSNKTFPRPMGSFLLARWNVLDLPCARNTDLHKRPFLKLQLATPFNFLPDDRQAVLPELARADADADAGGVGLMA